MKWVPIITNFKRPIRHLVKLILYENDVKLLKFKKSPVKVNFWYVWSVRFWLLIAEMNASRKAMEWLIRFYGIVNLILGCPLFRACVCYFLSNFYFSPSDSPLKTMKNVFDFI